MSGKGRGQRGRGREGGKERKEIKEEREGGRERERERDKKRNTESDSVFGRAHLKSTHQIPSGLVVLRVLEVVLLVLGQLLDRPLVVGVGDEDDL